MAFKPPVHQMGHMCGTWSTVQFRFMLTFEFRFLPSRLGTRDWFLAARFNENMNGRGRALVKALGGSGYPVRAVSRQPGVNHPDGVVQVGDIVKPSAVDPHSPRQPPLQGPHPPLGYTLARG
jgi:hypothetical protein